MHRCEQVTCIWWYQLQWSNPSIASMAHITHVCQRCDANSFSASLIFSFEYVLQKFSVEFQMKQQHENLTHCIFVYDVTTTFLWVDRVYSKLWWTKHLLFRYQKFLPKKCNLKWEHFPFFAGLLCGPQFQQYTSNRFVLLHLSQNHTAVLECWLSVGCIKLSNIRFGHAVEHGNLWIQSTMWLSIETRIYASER